MKLEKLIIKKTEPTITIVRDIDFKQGLNLIIDNTIGKNQVSGNNIGKTTLIKIIDLCLGGKDVKTIYFDSDTNSINEDVKDFLDKNKVVAELDIFTDKKIKIEKDLFPRGKWRVNGKEFSQTEYWSFLKKTIFNSNEKKPTLRSLIPKFIRISGLTSDRMLKYLPDSTKTVDYDAIYKFLFKLTNETLISKLNELENELKKAEKKINILKKDNNLKSLSSLEQKKELINIELSKYAEKKQKINFLKTNKTEIEKIRNLVIKIDDIESKIELLDLEIGLIKENIIFLENEKENINLNILKNIYDSAKLYVKKIEKEFEEVVIFHNTMVQNRKEYIMNDLKDKEIEIKNLILERDTLLSTKKEFEKNTFKNETLDDIFESSKKYDNLLIEKGEILKAIKILSDADKEKNSILKKISELKITNEKDNKKEIIAEFNKIFSDFSQKLYNEKYFISYDENWEEENKFPIICESLSGQLGTGKKKAVTIAFDLAYLEFSNLKNIFCPKFVIHDKLENTYINQLKTIFEISENIDGQLIVPILRERVNKIDENLIEKCKIVELSEKDKLFRI